MSRESGIPHFLADTWWYGLTDRLSTQQFETLCRLRVNQGFTAVQLVMGIPPETTPDSKESFGNGVPAWDRAGKIHPQYIGQALTRLTILRGNGLQPIIYGAWGDHVDWIGAGKMTAWWKTIIENTGQYEPIYCLTGEIDIPTPAHAKYNFLKKVPLRHTRLAEKAGRALFARNVGYNTSRQEKWDTVFDEVRQLTRRPVICHTTTFMTSDQSLRRARELAACTVQTGHAESSRQSLWRLPLKHAATNDKRPFINLEPWYEGISDNFFAEDQFYAYWSSMIAGGHAYCYGAHGIWNVGDGSFRNHWGTQTFEEAMQLSTPRKLGVGHQVFLRAQAQMGEEKIMSHEENESGELVWIRQSDPGGRAITFYPHGHDGALDGQLFSPARARFVKAIPGANQIVEFTGFTGKI